MKSELPPLSRTSVMTSANMHKWISLQSFCIDIEKGLLDDKIEELLTDNIPEVREFALKRYSLIKRK